MILFRFLGRMFVFGLAILCVTPIYSTAGSKSDQNTGLLRQAGAQNNKDQVLQELLMLRRQQKRLNWWQLGQAWPLMVRRLELQRTLNVPLDKKVATARLRWCSEIALSLLSMRVLQLLSLLVLLLMLWRFYKGQVVFWGWKFFWLLTLLLIAVCFIHRLPTALTATSQVRLRSGPGAAYPAMYNLPMGLELKLLEERNGFFKVDGLPGRGWVNKADLLII